MLDRNTLVQYLSMNIETCELRWRETTTNVTRGDLAGYTSQSGETLIKLEGKAYPASKLVWLWIHDVFSEKPLVYLNGDKSNHHISNLAEGKRPVKRKRNVESNGIVGYRGVQICHQTGRYIARIKFNGQRVYLGKYDSAEEAACVVEAAEIDLCNTENRDLYYVDIIAALDFNMHTGEFTWKINTGKNDRVGKKAGYLSYDAGYVMISLYGKVISASKLAWLIHYRQWPCFDIIHADGNKTNNSISNLVPKIKLGKSHDKIYVSNTSGYTGVSWIPAQNRYIVYIEHEGKRVWLGTYTCAEEAYCIREAASIELNRIEEVVPIRFYDTEIERLVA